MAGQNTKIVATDYNAIQSVINSVMGSGSGTTGWGQTVLSSQVAVNSKISVTQWNNLQTDLQNANAHITGSIGSLTTASTSVVIAEADRSAYQAMATYANSNQNGIPPANQASTQAVATGTKTVAWNGTLTHTVTITFASADNARYFFNSGSLILFSASLAGFSVSDGSYAKNLSWQTMLSNMGVIKLGLNNTTTTGSLTNIASSTGYMQLKANPGVNTLLGNRIISGAPYTPNQYDLYCSCNAGGTVLTFQAQFADLSTTGNPTYGTDENVSGTLTSLCQLYYASGSNVSVSAYLPVTTQSGP